MNANVTQPESPLTAPLPAEVTSYAAGGTPPFAAIEADWAWMTKSLLGFATARLARHGSYAFRYVNRPEDYVQSAVTLYLEGRRRSAARDAQELFYFLCEVISSLISHDAEKARRRGVHIPLTTDDPESGEVGEIQLPSDEDLEGAIMARDEFKDFLASLQPDLAQYVRLRAAGTGDTAEDYAAALGTTVAKIRSMDRRLRRRRDQWSTQ